MFGAGGGTRTHTPLLTTDFESAPSTNSSTSANKHVHIVTQKAKNVYTFSQKNQLL